MGRLLLLPIFLFVWSIQAQNCPIVEDTTQHFCASEQPTVADLSATANGDDVQWYDSSGTALSGDVLLEDGVIYYAGNDSDTCVSREGVEVELDLAAVAGTTSHIYLCSDSEPVNLQEMIWPIVGGPNDGRTSDPDGYFEGDPFEGTHIIDPANFRVGRHDFKYHVTTTCGTDETEVRVYIIETPKAGEDGIVEFAYDGDLTDLSTYLTDGATAGGVWTDENNNVLEDGFFDPTVHDPGFYTYTVSEERTGTGDQYIVCEDSASFEIIVHEPKNYSQLLICHKGETLSVNENALNGHLRHGDSLGICGSENISATVISPNPSRGDFNFSNESTVIKRVRVLDFKGNLQKDFENRGGTEEFKIDLDGMKKGIYFAEVITPNGKEVLRLVKK